MMTTPLPERAVEHIKHHFQGDDPGQQLRKRPIKEPGQSIRLGHILRPPECLELLQHLHPDKISNNGRMPQVQEIQTLQILLQTWESGMIGPQDKAEDHLGPAAQDDCPDAHLCAGAEAEADEVRLWSSVWRQRLTYTTQTETDA